MIATKHARRTAALTGIMSLCASLAACADAGKGTEPAALVSEAAHAPEFALASPRDHAVYSAVLSDLEIVAPHDPQTAEYCVVVEATDVAIPADFRQRLLSDPAHLALWLKDQPAAWETVSDFLDVQTDQRSVAGSQFTSPTPVRVVNSGRVNEWQSHQDPGKYWSGFWSEYPAAAGLYQLSRVGYDGEARQALVAVTRGAGGHNATTWRVLLEREGDTWRIVSKLVTGAS